VNAGQNALCAEAAHGRMLCVMYDDREQHGWREWLAVSSNLCGLVGIVPLLGSLLLLLGQYPTLALAAFCLSVPCLLFFISGYLFKSNSQPITSLAEFLSAMPEALEERPRLEINGDGLPSQREPRLISTKPAVQRSEVISSVETPINRTIENITPNDLIDFYDEFTPVQAEKLTKQYLGKWIRASGQIASMTLNASGVQILVRQLPNPNRMLHTYFPGYDAVRRYGNLRNNETITFTGEVKGVNQRTVSLDKCIFVDEEASVAN